MNNDFHPFYVRVGDSWTKIDYGRDAQDWMKPLVRGQETELIDIPGNWYLDDLPPMMFIKSAPQQLRFHQAPGHRGAVARPVRLGVPGVRLRGLYLHDPPRRLRTAPGAA